MSEQGEQVLSTRVGRISETELSFWGCDVAELLGRNYWQLVSMSVGGPALDAGACEVLDRLTTCMLACDPRIWPLKLVQLGGCYGSMSTALGVGVMAMGPSPITYWGAGEAARVLRQLGAELGSRPVRDVAQVWNQDAPPRGYGVHGRAVDQRVTLFRGWRSASACAPGHFEQLARELELVVVERFGQRLHIDGLVGAVLSDLGFAPEQVAPIAGVVLALPNILANAYEGGQRGPALRQMPPSAIRFAGQGPRRSLRSQRSTSSG